METNKGITIITGNGRSGTSLLVEILKQYGLRFGEMRGFYKDKRGGYEKTRLIRISNKMFNRHISSMKLTSEFIERLAKNWGDEIKGEISDADYIKLPALTTLIEVWIKAGIKIDRVIICLREPLEVAKSAKKNEICHRYVKKFNIKKIAADFYADLGNLYYVVNKYKIKNISVVYPDDYLSEEPLKHLAKELDVNYSKLYKIIKNTVDF